MRFYWLISVLALFIVLAAPEASSHPKSIGTSHSFCGFGIVYDIETSDDYFCEIQLRSETSELMLGRASTPGISASCTWNHVFARRKSSEGNTISFFAGPGFCTGYLNDWRSLKGIMVGLKGRIGTECNFRRNFSLSVCISPVIGAHISFMKNNVKMKIYRNGVYFCAVPEISLKYRF